MKRMNEGKKKPKSQDGKGENVKKSSFGKIYTAEERF